VTAAVRRISPFGHRQDRRRLASRGDRRLRTISLADPETGRPGCSTTIRDAITPLVATAATAARDGEAQVNALFATEIKARQALVDLLWAERKKLEGTLGRSGRGIMQFLFFDFQKARAGETAEEPAPPAEEPAAPTAPTRPR
jgi:hypothetical protein